LNDIQKSIRKNNNQKAIIDKKKKIFLNIPFIDIHYANADKIREIYYGFINELIRKKVVTETTNKKSGEAKAGYGGIGGKLSGDSSNKTVSEYEAPGISLDDMFLSVQTKTITQNQVRLGIEEVNIELTELQAFEQDIENLKKRYNFNIADGQVNEKNSELREKAAQRTLDNLEKVAGKVLVKGNFKIEADGDSYKYVYTHPVNEYITDKAEHVIISVRIPKNSLAPDFQTLYEKSLGESRPLNIYGSVWRPISRKDNIWEFQIKPLAVYSC